VFNHFEVSAMSVDLILGMSVSAIIFIYLLAVLARPERF
jgi:K+-transporting ATPase KdpF subunit